jgi:hypothetical protein
MPKRAFNNTANNLDKILLIIFFPIKYDNAPDSDFITSIEYDSAALHSMTGFSGKGTNTSLWSEV